MTRFNAGDTVIATRKDKNTGKTERLILNVTATGKLGWWDIHVYNLPEVWEQNGFKLKKHTPTIALPEADDAVIRVDFNEPTFTHSVQVWSASRGTVKRYWTSHGVSPRDDVSMRAVLQVAGVTHEVLWPKP